MRRRIWKRVYPKNLRDAMELCKEHARERYNLSVERIAERMGITDHWTLYKWFQNGRMPISLVRPFEDACGIDLITRWMAASTGRVLIDIPLGRKASAEDIQALQTSLNDAVGELLQFYADKSDAAQTFAALRHAIEGLAWHHGNVEKHLQPELEFGGEV
jgi:hypothetical protein